MRRFWRAETGIFIGMWLVLAVAGRSSLFQDPGTFWHTAIGRKMLETGQIPRTDPFSCTFGGEPWVATQWLAECGMAAAYHRLGWDGLLLGTVTLLAGLSTFVAHRLLRSGLTTMPTVLVVTVVAAACSHHFHARPHLATMLLLAVLMAELCDVESGLTAVRRLWWLAPMFVIWTNLHGGALAGWVTLLLAICGWLAWRRIGWESPLLDRRKLHHAVGVALLCAAAMLVSPYGIDTPRTWLRVMSLDLPDLIEEHAPLNFQRSEGAVTLLILAAYLAALASTWPRRPRVVWLLPLVWACLAVSRVRHAPLFALTAGIGLADILPQSRLVPWLLARGYWKTARRPENSGLVSRWEWRPWAVPIVLLLTVLGLQAASVEAPIVGRGWAQLDPALWPLELIEDFKQIEQQDRPPVRMFNSLDLGGFLTFYAPNARSFIDDRCELFGGDFLRSYAAAESSEPARLQQWAVQYDLSRALVRSGSPFDEFLSASSNWRLLHRTAAAAFYERTEKLRPDLSRLGPADCSRDEPGITDANQFSDADRGQKSAGALLRMPLQRFQDCQ